MSLAAWSLGWKLALARPRLFALQALAPLALVVPLAAAPTPPGATAAAFTAIVALFSALGTAALFRFDGERGMTARVGLGGMSPSAYLVPRAAAAAAADIVQLLPATLVLLVGVSASPADGIIVVLCMAATAWVSALVGMVAASVGRSQLQAGLLAFGAVVLLVWASGAFAAPVQGSAAGWIEALAPYRALHESVLDLSVPGPRTGGITVVAWCAALPAAVGLAGSTLRSGLGRTERVGLEGA